MSSGYGTFNANDFNPSNGGTASHPKGIFLGTISNAEIMPNKNKDGGYYAVTFKSNVGEVINRYNLWNPTERTMEIAREQLSALCRAVNYFQLNFDANGGRDLIGAPVMFEVGAQRVPSDPNDKNSAKIESPNLVEVKKVFSSAGIDPSAPGNAPVVPTDVAAASPQPAASAPTAFPQAAVQPAPVAAKAAPAAAPAPAWQQNAAAPAAGATATARPPWAS